LTVHGTKLGYYSPLHNLQPRFVFFSLQRTVT
jgi:hypothetical protein